MFESYFNSAADHPEPSPKASSSSSTPPPVFDKPVFDDDPDAIDPFDAIPLFGAGSGGGGDDDTEEDFLGGLKSAEKSKDERDQKTLGFDDELFPGIGGSTRSMEPVRDAKPVPLVEPDEVGPDDGVTPGFGGSTNQHDMARDNPMRRQEQEPMSSSKTSVSLSEDPFGILGATPKSEYSSFGLFSDFVNNIGMPAKTENTKVDFAANNSGRFQGSDRFAGFPKAMPSFSFVSEKESNTTGRSVDSIYSKGQSNHMPVQQGSTDATANILPEMNVSEPSVIHKVPIVTDFQTLNPFARDDRLPEKNKSSKMPDDVWLTVSDIILVTQPTSAPPPSRPPPPLVTKQLPTESVTTETYRHYHNQGYHHSLGSADSLKSSQNDDLEYFFMAMPAKFANGHPRVLNHEGTEQYSSTGTANFMRQSNLRDSKGIDQGDFGSLFTSSQYRQEEIDENPEFCVHEMEKINEKGRLENERKQREHDEEQRKAERERIEELEREREKVRQREQEELKRCEKEREARKAVEKAIWEARERAAVEARKRAESEARRRAERAAVQKAASEARERAAVAARERAAKCASEAKERATEEAREKLAAESQEKAAADARAKAERAAVEEAAAEVVEKAIREARDRAAVEARMQAEIEACRRVERAAVQKAAAEARERAAVEARERAAKSAAEIKEKATEDAGERAAAEATEKEAAESQEKAAAEDRAKAERAAVEKAAAEARRRAERAAFERIAAEVRQRAAIEAKERAAAEARARENQQKTATAQPDLESFFGMPSVSSSAPRSQTTTTNPFDVHPQGSSGSGTVRTASSGSASPFMQPASSNLMDDLSSILGELGGEREERRKPGLEREQRIMERAAKALAEKNERDLRAQREQEERYRIGEMLDIEIRRWAVGKEGNIRALLSTLQYILWPECGWRPVSFTDLVTAASVKKEYRKATLCIHPDKVQQKGANLQHRYIAEKVFDLLKEAWNKFNSEELF